MALALDTLFGLQPDLLSITVQYRPIGITQSSNCPRPKRNLRNPEGHLARTPCPRSPLGLPGHIGIESASGLDRCNISLSLSWQSGLMPGLIYIQRTNLREADDADTDSYIYICIYKYYIYIFLLRVLRRPPFLPCYPVWLYHVDQARADCTQGCGHQTGLQNRGGGEPWRTVENRGSAMALIVAPQGWRTVEP